MTHRNDLAPQNERAQIGGNNPPPEYVDDEFIKLAERGKLLADAGTRIPKADEEGAADKLAIFMKQCKEFQKLADKWRKDTKAPFIKAGKDIQNLGVELQNIVLDSMGVASKELNIIAKKRAEEEAERQRLAREEERKAQEEADRLAREAEESNDAIAKAQAKQAEKDLKAATKTAKAQKTNVKTEDGAQVVFKKVWDFDILDLNKIPVSILRKYLGDAAFEKAIRAAVKDGQRDIKGVKIYQKDQQSIR